jgi:urocanate hydratase
VEEANELRQRDPQAYFKRSMESMVKHVHAMLEMQKMGAVVFDYGNSRSAETQGEALAP